MRCFALCVVLWGVAACGGEGPDLLTRVPGIAVAPGALSFGEVGLPLSATMPLYVSNPGGADLVGTMSFEGFDGIFAVDQGLALDVEPGEELVLDVRFTPDTFRDYASTLVLLTNDPDHPEERIDITGTGADLPLPDILVRPGRTIEVFDKPDDQPALAVIELHNEGGAPLIVSSLRLEGSPAFSFTSPFEGTTIAPSSSVSVLVQYQAPGTDGELADLYIVSDDPDESEVRVRLLGNGGGPDLERPVALIECPSVVEINGPELVTLSGAKSYDPEGLEPLTWAWSVIDRPAASDADIELDPDDTESVDLYVDVAGSWQVQLVVENTLQTVSEPTVCSFDAVPEDDLRVELSWSTPTADVDLHLLRDDASLFDPDEDCHYCNQNPSWGTSSSTDDPRLDIDDRGGFGPENINIESPESSMTYDVKVHYFRRNDDTATTATVAVWMGGELVWSGQRVLEEANDVWDVGTVDIAANDFDPGTTQNYKPTETRCQ